MLGPLFGAASVRRKIVASALAGLAGFAAGYLAGLAMILFVVGV
jgi:hypothetical protein